MELKPDGHEQGQWVFMSTRNDSGRLELVDDDVAYLLREREVWRASIASLRLIGEFTTPDGPAAEDLWFVFVAGDRWLEASLYAEGREELLAELGGRLGHELRAGLCNSVTLASRVLWPPRLEGHPLFDFVPEEKASTILGRIRQRIFPNVCMRVTDEVKRELE